MSHSKYDQTLALAGIYQAASLVKQIANKGSANNAQIEACIETLFRFDANTVEEVYGDRANIINGAKVLQKNLTSISLSGSNKENRDIEITKYIISLIMLEKTLEKRPEMLDDISDRLKAIEEKFDFFPLGHDNTYAKLGHLYKETISTLGPKIIVSGEQPYLSNENNANKVRALLLAGIRSAVLWRQCGGSRWQFFFGQKAYQKECEKIIGRV
jgi:high frequency lysogenization protein